MNFSEIQKFVSTYNAPPEEGKLVSGGGKVTRVNEPSAIKPQKGNLNNLKRSASLPTTKKVSFDKTVSQRAIKKIPKRPVNPIAKDLGRNKGTRRTIGKDQPPIPRADNQIGLVHLFAQQVISRDVTDADNVKTDTFLAQTFANTNIKPNNAPEPEQSEEFAFNDNDVADGMEETMADQVFKPIVHEEPKLAFPVRPPNLPDGWDWCMHCGSTFMEGPQCYCAASDDYSRLFAKWVKKGDRY